MPQPSRTFRGATCIGPAFVYQCSLRDIERQVAHRILLLPNSPHSPSTLISRGGFWREPATAIDAQPIRGDRALRIGELHTAAAHLLVQVVLDGVFLVRIAVAVLGFRPEVGDIGRRATQFEADEVLSRA